MNLMSQRKNNPDWLKSEKLVFSARPGVKRNFWLHAMPACKEQYSTYQIRWENWWL